MGEPITVPWSFPNSPHAISLSIGNWPSGVYFVRLTANDGRVGYAPLIVRPAHLGEHRVAVVMPTYTWQAYNFEDGNGDGWGDTWYASWDEHATVRLGRHYLGRGIPPHFRQYDLNFLHWLTWGNRGVDYLTDSDIASGTSAATLAHAYDLIIFPGHHEYVTPREFRVMRGYRNLGGNLAYLSANNFYWHTVRPAPETVGRRPRRGRAVAVPRHRAPQRFELRTGRGRDRRDRRGIARRHQNDRNDSACDRQPERPDELL
jgi:hypothetical protein